MPQAPAAGDGVGLAGQEVELLFADLDDCRFGKAEPHAGARSSAVGHNSRRRFGS